MHFLITCFINICSHKTTVLLIHFLFCKDVLFSRYYKCTNFPDMTPNYESEHFNCCQNVYIYICKCFSVVKIDRQTSSYIFLWIDIFYAGSTRTYPRNVKESIRYGMLFEGHEWLVYHSFYAVKCLHLLLCKWNTWFDVSCFWRLYSFITNFCKFFTWSIFHYLFCGKFEICIIHNQAKRR